MANTVTLFGNADNTDVNGISAPFEPPGIEINGVEIERAMLLIEDEPTMQEVKGLQKESKNPDDYARLDRIHHERALKEAFEAAVNINELRDRITLLEKSLAEVRGAGISKPDDNKDDASFDPTIKGFLNLEPARISSAKWHHPKYAQIRRSSGLSISVRKSSRSPDVPQVTRNELNTVESETTKPLESQDRNRQVEEIPDRLEINSYFLWEDLLDATGIDLGETRVLLRPFKLLILYDQEIRHVLESRERSYKDLVNDAEVQFEMQARKESGTLNKPSVCSDEIAEPFAKPSSLGAMTTQPASVNGTPGRVPGTNTHLAGSPDTPPPVPSDARFDEKTALAIKVAKRRVDYLQLIVDFIDTGLVETQTLRRQISDGTLQKISFDNLWHLFNPGELIVNRGLYQAYRVLHVAGGRPLFSSERPVDGGNDDDREPASEIHRDWTRSDFDIDCFSMYYDGEEIVPVPRQITIPEYGGERAITSLAVFPLRFLKEKVSVREALLERGKRFKKVAGVQHKMYTGSTIGTPPEEIDSEVIVDFATSFLYNENWKQDIYWDRFPTRANDRETFEVIRCSHPDCTSCTDIYDDRAIDSRRWSALMDQNPNRMLTSMSLEDERLSEEHYELLPRSVNAYSLRNRRWYVLNLNLLRDVNTDEVEGEENGFADLVIPPDYKDLVEALVRNHSRGTRPTSGEAEKDHQVDLVKGKGKGTVILLHGVPGVGKTSTAECVAAYTKRPLYPITCGDIGDTAEKVEKSLEHHFRLAHQWGCVLLLDEADVFLAKRSGENLARNGLVSVFLRVLEYHQGILFLTSNRVGSFDEAFRSRIHLSLYYPPLSKDTTSKIWKTNLDRLNKSGRMSFNQDKIMEFADKQFQKGTRWNGRQIRNAFQTAIALAGYDHTRKLTSNNPSDSPAKPKLTKDHFKKVAKASADFDDYVKEVMGGEDYARKAEIEEVRADTFGIDQSPSQSKVRASRGPMSTPSRADFSADEDSDEDAKERRREKEKRTRREQEKERTKTRPARRKGSAAVVSSSGDSDASD